MADTRVFVSWAGERPETATGGAVLPDIFGSGPTPTQSSARLTDASGFARNIARSFHATLEERHQINYMSELRLRTKERLGVGSSALIAELGDLGFAWRDVARMLNVSVPAIQKWRKGEGLTGPNARKIASLLAACDLIARFNPLLTDIALWFETPVADGIDTTPIDLWSGGAPALVLEFARAETDPHQLLDEHRPGWRATSDDDFETFRAGDGQLSIRVREKQNGQ